MLGGSKNASFFRASVLALSSQAECRWQRYRDPVPHRSLLQKQDFA